MIEYEKLYITHEQYARMLEIVAESGYGNDGAAKTAIRREFNLKQNQPYDIVIVDPEPRQ